MRSQLHCRIRRDWAASAVSDDGKAKHKTMTLNNLARNRRRMSSNVVLFCHLTLFWAIFGFASGQTSDLVFTIDEEQPPGVLVGAIPTESGYTYTLSDPPVEFELNRNNGEIRTSQVIDREQLQDDVFDLLVLATSNSRTNPIEVRIIVADLNDNSPAFPEPNDRISFSENGYIGTQVILESATDPDKASNGNIVQYAISDGNSENAFRLVVIPGPDGLPIYIHLETTFSLDYESQDFYQLTISARDDGSPSRSGFLHLNISVHDNNDNPPIFDQSEFIISINESTPAGTRLLDVHATDGDSGINGIVEYFIDEEDTSNFNVEPDSGRIILQQMLDYVSSDPYQVTVKARDKGSPTLSGRAFLSVFVIDENDHDPQISFGFYSDTGNFATVTEGAAVGSIVALVTVTDDDQGENGEVNLQILNGNELQHFTLETLILLVPGFSKASIFKLLVASEVDRENVEQYNLTLVAHDNGSPRRQMMDSLIVHVVDTNDHPPEFQETDYLAVLSEGEPIGSFVQSLTATDADSGLNAVIVYSISAGNDLQWFEINSETGLVTTKAQLNREIVSAIELNITAIDKGILPMSSSTTLTVTILDENDEAPVFTDPSYTASVPENIIGRYEVISVSAVDGDQGTNGLVLYAFTADVEHQYPGTFSIDAVSGTIFTEMVLNHEDTTEYDLSVRAYDAGDSPRESLVNVHIDVVDENDNVPIFYPQTYLVTIQENEPDNTFVERVTASDSDSGNYGTVTYSIVSGNAAGKFQIDGSTGVVTTTSALDREEESSYTLVISATDGGGQVAELNSEVHISVGDIQDNPPAFDESQYEFEILESADSNSLVGQVTASSQDLNAQITYTIFSGDPNGQFEINDVNGEIRTRSNLDRETTSSYELIIYASGRNMFGRTTVDVIILDVNDNSPQFLRSRDSTDVVENWEVGRHFYQAKATDEDSSPNGIVVYDIINNPDNTFGINRTTGWLFLTRDLQGSTQDEYVVQIRASDLGTPRMTASLELIVTVRDVNNHSPEFAAQLFQTSISETTDVNFRFVDLEATDRDQGTNGLITYSIISGNDGDAFGIFPDGQVYVKNFLDRESISEYTLNVEARDGGIPSRTASTELVVEILDENDNRPFFDNSSYIFNLQEGSAINTIVGTIFATDRDLGDNAELTYSFVENQTQFSLNPITGVIKNLVGFDREALQAESGRSHFTLDAVVRDSGVVPFQDRSSMTIVISDINDNAPVFSRSSYQATISELAENGTHVLRITASDSDIGDNSYIVYSIMEGNEEKKFHIGRTSGQVTLIGLLDRETTSEYSLTIKAQDAGSVPMSKMVGVTIEVLDENDHMPIFTQTGLELEVTECLAIGEPITMVSATDVDIGENGLISYSITGGDIQNAFRVNPDTGDITLSKLLDHETKSSYTLNVTARDSGYPPQTSVTSIVVHVRDCNDNSPVFPQHSVVIWIDEEIALNTLVAIVTASDSDSGINGDIRYSIESQDPDGEHFIINRENGRIVTNARIDYEYLKAYSGVFKIIVKATDQALPRESRRDATSEVVIFVRDINDNSPVFQTHNAVVLSRDAAVGSTVTTVTARDPDDGENGEVTYNLINRSVPFEINSETGEVELTRNIEASTLSYTLLVNAEDGGQIPGRTSSEITILIVDDTNNGPTFARTMYTSSISENNAIGTEVVTISAGYLDDSDVDIEYYITSVIGGDVSREGDFQMMTTTGVISTGVVLDRELLGADSLYVVTVYAVDRSSTTPRTTNTEVMITVLDENDSPPIFARQVYNANISEEVPSSSPIAILVAQDADIGSNADISYSIISGNDGHFTIDPNNGQIRTSGQLDRETMAKYSLGIRASDGRQSTVTTLDVNIQDANDNDPLFTKTTYSFTVYENHVVGTAVDAVSAMDPDTGTNGDVVYSIVTEGAPGEDVFRLDSLTGEFTLVISLDYEQKQLYFLTVQANDRGTVPHSSTATVYFNVLDINDNSPVFDPTSYWVDVTEDVDVGTEIIAVQATDADSGSNAEIAFTISSGDPSNSFTIHPNGSISTVMKLDRETQSFYNLEITATDQAIDTTQRKSSQIHVTVIVLDMNDNSPVFTTGNYVSVREDTSVGEIVMFVQATDADVEKNSYIEFSLSPVPDDVFLINPVDGNIRLWNALDREMQSEYTLTVHATDKGQPPQSTSMDIFIKVSDVNDNRPVFDPATYHSTLPEDVPLGLEFLEVFATDADEGVNAELRFSIINGNYDSDFDINPITGILSVANLLDHERRSSYSLTIRAQDNGDGSRFSSVTVTINVEDINDNAPVFPSRFEAEIMENNQPAALVIQVSATDDDGGANGQLTYRIEGNDYDGLFTIIPDTGAVRVGASLDREEVQMYTLTVFAQDAGNPSLETSTELTITVTDDNDNQPEFEFPSYTTTIPEGISTNSPVIQVTATDEDSSANLRYRLDNTIGSKFTIEPVTGEILTAGPLNREEQPSYDIIVTVEDGDTWTSQTVVTVQLDDINDNAPQFRVQSYQALIPSTTPLGTYVIAVEAQDADIGDNAKLTYSIVNSDTNRFTVNADTGFITTARQLTSESGSYTLEVSAADSNPSHTAARVTVLITLDISGQFPVFQNPSDGTMYTIREDTSANSVVVLVQAVSPKTGQQGIVTYHIIAGNTDNSFTVNEQSGRLAVNTAGLNYEANQRFALLVEARDGDTLPLSSLLQVIVNVVDVNDNYPVFDQAGYSGNALEGQSSGLNVVQIHATDADSALLGNIIYSVRIGSNPNNNFKINRSTGWLQTNKVLDRESIPEYTLTVQAEDEGSPAKTARVTVHVTVDDINDNELSFTNLFSATIPENSPIGTDVITITTSDLDVVNNIRYSILSDGPSDFVIDSLTGKIHVNGTLDREIKNQYQLLVSAGDESFVKDTTVTITISDVNDNSPTFSQPSYSVSLPEGLASGSSALQVSATDIDIGANQDIYYTMKSRSDYFIINEDTGYITIKTPVDYIQPVDSSNPNVYHLEVLARDRGVPSLYTEAQVTVTIYDANEYPPVFQETEYFSPVPFNSQVNDYVLQIIATESLDQGQNAHIQYSIIGGNGSSLFDIEEDSGWIKVRLGLQSDVGNYYNIIVEAKDQGLPSPMSAQVNVQLLVTGSNDNTPMFDQPTYQVSVNEDLAVGSEVRRVSATDLDSGVNGMLLYSFVSGNERELFAIEEETGLVTVAQALDYEEFTSHTMQITVRDQGWNSKHSSTVLTVDLLDVDDNAPIFNPAQYDPEVAENSPSATYVTMVTAMDADTGTNAEFTYDIIGGDGVNLFIIDHDSGVIRTQGNLDYEGNLKVFQLSIEAANEDTSQFGIAHVTVHLTGVNEDNPKFVQSSYQFSVNEAEVDGAVVGMLYASDGDQGVDGQVQYLLVGSSNQQGFAINLLSGEIIVSKANGELDRETKDTITLSVLAKNLGPITGDNIDEAQVTINILDANDPPQFLDDLYQATVSEGDDVGTFVTIVTAVEYDQSNDFRQFSYAIMDGNHQGAFEIDPLSGSITIASELDRERVATYRLRVGAIDTGNPPQTGFTDVVINIDDVNDNGPVFLPGNDVGLVYENEAPFTNVMILNATDPDVNSNPSLFTFTLIPNSDSSSFTLDSNSGLLRTTRTLDRELKSDYYLSIESRDGAVPEMTAVSTIHIIVQDQNDNPSSARDARIEVKAYQSVFPGGAIGVVRPNDLDTGDMFVCQIVNGDQNVFSIQSGCQLNSRMHSTESEYTLEITGDDGQHPAILSDFSVSYKAFNNDSLTNSITLRLSDLIPETFLSDYYDRFSASLSTFLNNRESLLVLSLNNIEKEVNKMDLTLAIKKDNGYTLRDDVAKLISDNKATIMSQSGVIIDVADYSPCSRNPCSNSGTCADHIKLEQTQAIIDSPSIIFVSPVMQRVFKCDCINEFFGPTCDEQINQCESNPCMNGATCIDEIGGYTCTCALGYTGNECAININDCASNPCSNGGTCQDQVGTYTCHCKPGYSGDNCENGPCTKQPCRNDGRCIPEGSSFRCECQFGEWGDICQFKSIGFQQGSYMEFAALPRSQNIITMQFTTVSSNSLLLYNHDGTSSAESEFFTVEVISGKLQLSYNLGDGVTVISTDMMIADGRWHSVEARRIGKDGMLTVDDCPSFQPGDYCRASGGNGNEMYLDVNDVPLSLGGTQSINVILDRSWQVSSADFLGCIRDVYINGQPLDLSTPLAERGTGEGCDRNTKTCNDSQCSGNSVCMDEWWTHWCQCQAGSTGDNCDKVPTAFSFGGNSFVEYVVKESFQRQQLLDAAKADTRRRRRDTIPSSQTISMSFRTGSSHGLLLLVESGADFTALQIVNREVHYSFGSAGQTKGSVSLQKDLSDWKWHSINLYREGATISLQVGEDRMSERFNNDVPHDFTGLDVSGMSLGGTKTPLFINGKNITAFSGCLEDFKMNGKALPLDGANEMFDAVPSESTGEGCDVVNVCLPNPCPEDQICNIDRDGYSCECKAGFTGDECKIPATGRPSDNTVVIVLVTVFSIVLIVIVFCCFLLLLRYRNKAKKARETAVNHAKNTFSMDSLDNPGFSSDTFDNPTMIGSHNKTANSMDVIRQQPDIIEQNVHTDVPGDTFIVDTDDVVIGEEASGTDLDVPEHYDLENASSIAPSDIEPAYHYRYYHDGRERKQKRHAYRYSPNPMLARIGTPPCESPVSQTSSRHTPTHINISHNPNPNSLHLRSSPSGIPHSTPMENMRPSPAGAMGRQSPALKAMRQSPALLINNQPTMRSTTPLCLSRANTPIRNVASPVGSDHSFNQSELRSQGHHSDVSSLHSGQGDRTHVKPMPRETHRPPRPRSRLKEKSPGDPSRSLGLTVEEVKRLNTARPDLMTGSHASTIDNLSSVNSKHRHHPVLPPLPSDLEPSPLLEPPESSSSDETAGSFTCSEVDSENEKLKLRDLDPGMLLLSRLSQVDDGVEEDEEAETYEQFSAPFKKKEGLNSTGGSLSTLFASEDETMDPQKTNGQFSWDQFLNWGPRFETFMGVFADISQLQDTTPPEKTVYIEQTAEEFV